MPPKLQAALIGAGAVARRHHLPAFKRTRQVEVVALCDTNRRRARTLAKDFRVPRVYCDYLQLLSKEEPDFVDICTPQSTHVEICSAALNEGMNVIVEKPLCLKVPEALALQKLSEMRGASLCVMHKPFLYAKSIR